MDTSGAGGLDVANGAGLSRKVSWALDECIQVPGTKISFGLDPILGLLPYGGETVATIVGATILGDAGKKGLPVRTLLKMSGNMLLNAVVGVIPFVGDFFSVWFKSNTRNYKLLNTYLESDKGEEASGGWGPFFIVFGSVALVLLLNILTWIFFLFQPHAELSLRLSILLPTGDVSLSKLCLFR